MVRKTKAETEKTRQDIIAAARDTFAEHGVARTSLEQVAQAAGVTRGAVYWHFANKLALMKALRDDVVMPLLDKLNETLRIDEGGDPLDAIERYLLLHIDLLESDPVVRQTFEVLMNKCEYVGELGELLEQAVAHSHEKGDTVRQAYICAHDIGIMRPDIDPSAAMQDSHAFMFGLIRLWVGVSSEQDNPFRQMARQMIRHHIAMRRA